MRRDVGGREARAVDPAAKRREKTCARCVVDALFEPGKQSYDEVVAGGRQSLSQANERGDTRTCRADVATRHRFLPLPR